MAAAVAVYQIPIVAAAIWIAYVLASKRVRNTFKAKEAN
jgi:hypothetical protein